MAEAGGTMGAVAEVWRYPVQSMRGESLAETALFDRGVVGDRTYGLVDPETGEVVSSAQGRRKWRGVVTLGARFRHEPADPSDAPAVEIALPDGTRLHSDRPDIDARLAAALGAPVRLVVKRHAGVRSPYDHAAIHLLTTASCRALRRQHPEGRFEAARFRPNLVIDTGDRAGFVENQWIGREIAIGEARLRVTEHCVRCVMTVLAQGDLPEDLAILQTVREANETRAGIYAEVTRPGRVARGDAAAIVD